MEYPKITHLYKYYPYNSNSLSVLIDEQVWFSKPSSLNDPFDLDIDLKNHMNSGNFVYAIEDLKNQPGISHERKRKLEQIQKLEITSPDPIARGEAMEVIRNKLCEDLQNSGMFCMSELNDNILMWSHYTNNHKGFCVEFVRSSQNQLGDIERTNPAVYTCHYPIVDLFSDEGKKRSYDDLFLTKWKGWSYEREWRMINEEGDIALPLPGDISAVIFGLKMPLQNKETIKKQ
ncbi:MAG: DUF2971 domain-containing protein [Deltaproteobacteria bacterium]|nr:DUF2971 domain-containing protein [Deltaproteobacteria bacterium]